MKKVWPFILATIILAGCKKNNVTPDPNANNPTLILGKWKDGPTTSTFYTAGNVVYTQTYPAPTTVADYYQFNTDGTFVVYMLNSGVFTASTTLNYSLTNSNTTLHLSSGSNSTDDGITFPDNSTLVITSTSISTSTNSITYYLNGTNVPADKEVDVSTLYKY